MTAKDAPLQFKGTTLKIIQTQLRSTDLPTLHATLAELTGNAPDFFDNDLAVLDFVEGAEVSAGTDWAGLRALLAQSGLHAVATRGLPEELAAEAAAAGLPAISADALGRPQKARPAEPTEATPAAPVVEAPAASAAPTTPADTAPVPEAPAASTPPPAAEPAPRTITLDKPLRSGQRFYAKGCDLVVTAMVSAGAEVIADGHIHVYAPLRGRALAGASGDRTARIFTTSLEAELVSVAGLYRTFEAGVPAELARQPATVSLTGEGEAARLSVAPLALR